MKRRPRPRVRLAAGALAIILTLPAAGKDAEKAGNSTAEANWPAWRGPRGTGVAPRGEPPIEWGEGKNVRWKVAVPGLGHSTPVVWEDHVFLTTAVPSGEALPPIESKAPGAHD